MRISDWSSDVCSSDRLVLMAGCRLETREEAARHAASGQSADIEGMAAEALRALPTAIVDKATPFDPHHKGDAVLAVRLTGKVLAVTGGERARSMTIATDGDGRVDAIVPLGPVVRGTSLRDALGPDRTDVVEGTSGR